MDRVFTRVENQSVIWLPMNSISEKLAYDQRLIVSAPMDCPITWKISKLENTLPLGINHVVLYQDPFDRDKDYVNLETGEMFADYYATNIIPIDEPRITVKPSLYGEIEVPTGNIRIGGGYKTIQVSWFNQNGDPLDIESGIGDWSFFVGDEDAADLLDIREAFDSDGNLVPNAVKVKFTGGYEYLTKILRTRVVAPGHNIYAEKTLEIMSL